MKNIFEGITSVASKIIERNPDCVIIGVALRTNLCVANVSDPSETLEVEYLPRDLPHGSPGIPHRILLNMPRVVDDNGNFVDLDMDELNLRLPPAHRVFRA